MADSMLMISVEELCQSHQLNQQVIIEVVEYGIAKPVSGRSAKDWHFDTDSAHWLKKAVRLHDQLEIDWFAVALIVNLLKQQEQLKFEIDRLRSSRAC